MGLTYAQSGVDIDAGHRLIDKIHDPISQSMRPEILGDVGGFAALATLPTHYKEPVLVCGTDGVGTKLLLAIQHEKHDTIGQDLVAMCVNDILVYGAEPLMFLDYYATGLLDVDIAAKVIAGIARACTEVGCALAGGETAELPGLYQSKTYDLAGFCVGVVERSALNSREHISKGDAIIGIASNGPHSNGYSLIRKLLDQTKQLPNDRVMQEILSPTRLYTQSILKVADQTTGMAHITGGGLIENPIRMLSDGLAIEFELSSWTQPVSFEWINSVGQIEPLEMYKTFNCGLGFIIAVRPNQVDAVLKSLIEAGEDACVVGRVISDNSTARGNTLVTSKSSTEMN